MWVPNQIFPKNVKRMLDCLNDLWVHETDSVLTLAMDLNCIIQLIPFLGEIS